jgi:hypothetical protein
MKSRYIFNVRRNGQTIYPLRVVKNERQQVRDNSGNHTADRLTYVVDVPPGGPAPDTIQTTIMLYRRQGETIEEMHQRAIASVPPPQPGYVRVGVETLEEDGRFETFKMIITDEEIVNEITETS